MTENKIVLFCSSSYNIDPELNKAARDVVRALCHMGYTLVSGGAIKGTMGVLADEAAKCGGRHIGILPRFMKDWKHPGLTETVWTDTMSERKEKMREGTCAAIALPGGIGTLDEIVETLTLAKLGKYGGKVFALNYRGFYKPFIDLLDYYVNTGMLDPASRELIMFPDTVDKLVESIG
ncbi:MAG: TIGR00730 family Rossman fold protein [Bacteroidales bacterium]|jgi:uncharacterized protein (TIGR00730 family)|nr:TIGR00730 family Rossman fold protein [Bacteroidales bacterium]